MSFRISMTRPAARRRRLLALAAAAVGCVLWSAGPAVAATTGASVREGTFGRTPVTGRVLFVDDKSSLFASKNNVIAIALRDGAFEVTELSSGGRARADDGCREIADNRLRCSASGVVAIVVDAESGDDRVTITAPTRAIVTAGSGRDRVTDGDGSGELDGGSGDDTLLGGRGADVLIGGDGNDRLEGDDGLFGGGADLLAGGDGDDQLFGGSDDDRLDGDAGADSLQGGPGLDTVTYRDRSDPVQVTLPSGDGDFNADDGNEDDGPLGARDRVGVTVERVLGGGGDDLLIGSVRSDVFGGGAGGDTIQAREGDDVLDGEGGDDRLDGGAGNDRFDGGPGADALGPPGRGDDGDDTMNGGPGPDQFFGGAGFDTVTYADRTEDVAVDLDIPLANNDDDDGGEQDGPRFARDTVAASGVAGIERVIGGRGNDFLEASETLAAELHGGPGNDRLQGGRTAGDVLDGGDGNDAVDGDDPSGDGAGPDILRGGGGADKLSAADGSPEAVIDCGDDPPTRSGSASRENENDAAVLDLTDPAPVGCETVVVAAVDQHPTVRIASRALRLTAAGDRAAIALRCPRATPGGACRGRLTLRRRDRRRILAAARYALLAGQRTRVRVTLARRGTRHLRAVTAVAAERDPDGRPKTTIKRLSARR